MTPAYDKLYLEKARTALARMLDFAVHDLQFDLAKFYDYFLSSDISERFERGDFTVLVGKSGIELTYDVLESNAIQIERVMPQFTHGRSEEYWTGWALAYYQWFTSLRFTEIADCVSIHEIKDLYSPYHEMDIRQFTDKMTELCHASKTMSNLKHQRQLAGLSQRELSKLSNVPLRTIQQYEQKQKNINKAQVEYLVRLSRALCCDMELLLEKI